MQQIGPVLADPLLQIGDAAGQLSPLVLQSGNDMRFGHNPYPLEKMGVCSSCQRYLASRSWWRLIHKTGVFRSIVEPRVLAVLDAGHVSQIHVPLVAALWPASADGIGALLAALEPTL